MQAHSFPAVEAVQEKCTRYLTWIAGTTTPYLGLRLNSVPKSSQSNCGTLDKMPALPSFPLLSIQRIKVRTAIPCDPSLHGKMEMKVFGKQRQLSTDEKMGRFDYSVESPACVTLSKEHERDVADCEKTFSTSAAAGLIVWLTNSPSKSIKDKRRK